MSKQTKLGKLSKWLGAKGTSIDHLVGNEWISINKYTARLLGELGAYGQGGQVMGDVGNIGYVEVSGSEKADKY